MSFPQELSVQRTEYACVIRLVNCFLAVHRNGKKTTFISEHPEIDIKIAQTAAQVFAESHQIPYHDQLLDPIQPILTVLKHGEEWFPAELHPDKISLLTASGDLSLGGTQQVAIYLANAIAVSKGTDCLPQVGISLENNLAKKELIK